MDFTATVKGRRFNRLRNVGSHAAEKVCPKPCYRGRRGPRAAASRRRAPRAGVGGFRAPRSGAARLLPREGRRGTSARGQLPARARRARVVPAEHPGAGRTRPRRSSSLRLGVLECLVQRGVRPRRVGHVAPPVVAGTHCRVGGSFIHRNGFPADSFRPPVAGNDPPVATLAGRSWPARDGGSTK